MKTTWTVTATKQEIEKVLNSELASLVVSYNFEIMKPEFDPFNESPEDLDVSEMIVTDYSAVSKFLGRI